MQLCNGGAVLPLTASASMWRQPHPHHQTSHAMTPTITHKPRKETRGRHTPSHMRNAPFPQQPCAPG